MMNATRKFDVIAILSTILMAVFGWWTVREVIKVFALPSFRSDSLRIAFYLGALVFSGAGAYFAFALRRRDNRARRIVTAMVLCFVFIQVGLTLVAIPQKAALREQLIGFHNEAAQGGLPPPSVSVEQFDRQMRERTLKAWMTIIGLSGPLLIVIGLLNFGRFRKEFDVAI